MDDQEPEISQKDTQNLLMILRSLKEPLTVSYRRFSEARLSN